MQDIFDKINNNRKEWLPIFPTGDEHIASEEAVDTINKALSLRKLEIPVKEFILEGLDRADTKQLGKSCISTLLRNTLDEERHDIALENVSGVYKHYGLDYTEDVSKILSLWEELPDHPILKAAVLENGIFFVILPFFRTYGGHSLRTTSMDISTDEAIHVQSHRLTAKMLGVVPSKALNELRRLTVAWIFKGYNKDKYIQASDELMERGITSQLNDTRSYTDYAFFEHSNRNLPYYA